MSENVSISFTHWPLPDTWLAIDTSSETVHLALHAAGHTHAVALAGGAQASATTLPGLQQLLASQGLRWQDLGAVAFGQGPGAFTGLRTACSLAQGLALALEIPVLPMDTLMAVAESARQQNPAVAQWLSQAPSHWLWVVQDARMQEIYAAAYAWTAATGWQCQVPAAIWAQSDVRQHLVDKAAVCAAGSALRVCPDVPGVLRYALDQAAPTGQALAALVPAVWHQSGPVDAALALPLYVRDKVAQTTQERSQARLQAAAG
jgi:tRNA threonylcarbamoyladenosine biosynthesis protein TsaB